MIAATRAIPQYTQKNFIAWSIRKRGFVFFMRINKTKINTYLPIPSQMHNPMKITRDNTSISLLRAASNLVQAKASRTTMTTGTTIAADGRLGC